MLKYLFIIVAYIGLSAATAEPSKLVIGRDFSLGIGQTITVEGTALVIKFKAILEDSRCPINAFCMSRGNGRVEFEIRDIDGQEKNVVLNTEDEPKVATLKVHKLKLLSLDPPRIDGTSISREDYTVTLSVERSLSK